MKPRHINKLLGLILFIFSINIQTACKKESRIYIIPVPTPIPSQSNQIQTYWDSIFTKMGSEMTYAHLIFKKAKMDSLLRKEDSLLILPPPNNELEKSGYSPLTIEEYTESDLRKMFLYWTIPAGKIPHDQTNFSLKTLGGDSVFITWIHDAYFVNGASFGSSGISYHKNNISFIPFQILLTPPQNNLLQILQNEKSLSFFNAAISRASMGSTDMNQLLEKNTLTLLAPDDNAFRAAGFQSIQDIDQRNPDELANLLKYHMLENRQYRCNLDKYFFNNFYGTPNPNDLYARKIQTLNGDSIIVEYVYENYDFAPPEYSLRVQGKGSGTTQTHFLAFDHNSKNGVIHIIDKILLP